jgi:hypothetical protein
MQVQGLECVIVNNYHKDLPCPNTYWEMNLRTNPSANRSDTQADTSYCLSRLDRIYLKTIGENVALETIMFAVLDLIFEASKC